MAHVFGSLLRQNFRCGRMPNSRVETSGRVGLLCIACKISRRTVFSAREL